MTLVGRDEELSRLDAVLDTARSGAGATLLIEGPAGIGKTSLLLAARERARAAGMTVLQARGSALEREYAMGIVRQALVPAVRAHADRSELFVGAARLAEDAVLDVPDAAEATPAGVLHGLYWLTADLAERAPVLLAVDDAHWADEPSLRFLAYLARRAESVPVALVICARGEPDTAAPLALGEIRADRATVLLQPSSLAAAEVAAFLRALAPTDPVDDDFARACHEASGGNPFLLGELARALRSEGVAFTTAGTARVTAVTPPAVARAVRSTLDRLGPRARALAQAVAVLGDDVQVGLAGELAGIPTLEAAFAAGELASAGILDDAAVLRFRHPVLAGAVRADRSTAANAAAHAHAAELLRTRGADPERVCAQLLHAMPSGSEAVVGELRRAAARAQARGAPTVAVALLRRALGEPPSAAERPGLLLELGEAEYAVGHSREAGGHLEQAHRAAREPVTRGRALLSLLQTGTGELAADRALAAHFAETTPAVAAVDRELALRLRASQVVLAGQTPGDRATVLREGDRLAGATPGEAILLSSLAFVLTSVGGTADEVAGLAERAARQADALLEEGAIALMVTGIVLALRWSDRLTEAERLLDRAVTIAQRRGSTNDFAIALSQRAAVHRRAGRLREAEADARTALGAALEPEWWHLGHCWAALVGALVDQGRIDEAAQELAAIGDENITVDSPSHIPLLLERMRLRAAQGDPGAALADWEAAAGRAARLRGISPSWIEDLAVAAEVRCALGDRDGVASLLDQTLDLARRWGTPGSVGQALHAAARLGDGADAVAQLETAVEHLSRSPARLELARAQVTLGSTLRRSGQRVASREPLRRGYELARGCEAASLAEHARNELRASGVRVRREILSGVDSLTASERRIADLAAAGASNRQIAQDLFLTVKTVEMHLTRAYRKLDIGGRAELAGTLSPDL